MGGAGFEPAKAEPTDLQSVPFDRFGNPPNRDQCINQPLPSSDCFYSINIASKRSCIETGKKHHKVADRQNTDQRRCALRASGGSRTHDLLITNQLLCQLSYAGTRLGVLLKLRKYIEIGVSRNTK